MLNPNEYELKTVIGMPSNTIIGIDRAWLKRIVNPADEIYEESLTMHPKLAELLLPYITKNPDWRFEALYPHYSSTRNIDHFNVYKGTELLGEVALKHDADRKYYVNTPTIRQHKERRGGRETKDLKIARRLMVTMSPKTLSTKAAEARASTKHRLETGVRTVQNQFLEDVRELTSFLRGHIIKNLAPYIDLARSLGMKEESIEKLMKNQEEYMLIKPIADAVQSGKGKYVYIENGVYIVSNPLQSESVNDHVTYSDSDRLPDYIRRGVGMLKLSEDLNFIHNVGFRFKENFYYVLEEQGV